MDSRHVTTEGGSWGAAAPPHICSLLPNSQMPQIVSVYVPDGQSATVLANMPTVPPLLVLGCGTICHCTLFHRKLKMFLFRQSYPSLLFYLSLVMILEVFIWAMLKIHHVM